MSHESDSHVVHVGVGAQGYVYVESEEEIQATIGQAIKQLREQGIKTEAVIAHGQVVDKAIEEIAASWQADLVTERSGN